MKSKKVINWGIIGTGKSAHNFAVALSATEYGRLLAVGSRNKKSAHNFAEKFNLLQYFSSYSQLANSPKVDVIYIATPNSCHKENVLLCLNAGKGVLVEKSFVTNVKDAELLINLSKKKNLFLMEAMWTRYVPAFLKIEQLINSGEIGEIRSFQATLGQPSKINLKSNLFGDILGGGSLLDLGVYPIFWSHFLFGLPIKIQSNIYYGSTDVDLTSSIMLSYDDGKQSNIMSSIATRFSNRGVIYGTKGSIEIHQPLYCPTSISVIKYKNDNVQDKKSLINTILCIAKKSLFFQNLYANYPLLSRFIGRTNKTTINLPIKGNGLQYMANEVSSYLANQTDDSRIIPLSTTMSVVRTIEVSKVKNNVIE
jgi:dihydrodiol dehydrogenase / D-xylose 1-dehydrogenase (NADP)